MMSSDIETVAMAINNSKIPRIWLLNSYPTLKSLASYIRDLQQRAHFFEVIQSECNMFACSMHNLIKSPTQVSG